jgi:hypothetical protein
MSKAHKLFVVLALGLSVATFGTQAIAQQGAQQSARDAAIHKCSVEAHRQYPNSNGDNDVNRTDSYRTCMVSAGFQP